MITTDGSGSQDKVNDRYCRNCAAPLEENQRFCAKCGRSTSRLSTRKANSRKWMILLSVLSIALLATVAFFALSPKQSIEQKYAIQAIEAIQKKLIAPHTIQVSSVFVEIDDKPNVTDSTNKADPWTAATVMVGYSAMNRGGGYTSGEAAVKIMSDGKAEVNHSYSEREMDLETDLELRVQMARENLVFTLSLYTLEDAKEVDAKVIQSLITK